MSKEDVDRIMWNIDKVTNDMMQDFAFTIHGILVGSEWGGTPVDTGYASAKWWFGVGRLPARTADDNDVSGALDGQTRGFAGLFNYTINEGSIFIYNDTRYIEILNNGSSKKAPAFFIEDAIDKSTIEMQRKYGGWISV